jgi:hypothetical protein
VACVPRLHELSRAEIRQAFEKSFTAERMASQYCSLYEYLASPACEAVSA